MASRLVSLVPGLEYAPRLLSRVRGRLFHPGSRRSNVSRREKWARPASRAPHGETDGHGAPQPPSAPTSSCTERERRARSPTSHRERVRIEPKAGESKYLWSGPSGEWREKWGAGRKVTKGDGLVITVPRFTGPPVPITQGRTHPPRDLSPFLTLCPVPHFLPLLSPIRLVTLHTSCVPSWGYNGRILRDLIGSLPRLRPAAALDGKACAKPREAVGPCAGKGAPSPPPLRGRSSPGGLGTERAAGRLHAGPEGIGSGEFNASGGGFKATGGGGFSIDFDCAFILIQILRSPLSYYRAYQRETRGGGGVGGGGVVRGSGRDLDGERLMVGARGRRGVRRFLVRIDVRVAGRSGGAEGGPGAVAENRRPARSGRRGSPLGARAVDHRVDLRGAKANVLVQSGRLFFLVFLEAPGRAPGSPFNARKRTTSFSAFSGKIPKAVFGPPRPFRVPCSERPAAGSPEKNDQNFICSESARLVGGSEAPPHLLRVHVVAHDGFARHLRGGQPHDHLGHRGVHAHARLGREHRRLHQLHRLVVRRPLERLDEATRLVLVDEHGAGGDGRVHQGRRPQPLPHLRARCPDNFGHFRRRPISVVISGGLSRDGREALDIII
eukprot:1187581-Prorocentrum_minimum.AAC.3